MDEYIEKEAVTRYLKGYSEKELNSMSPYGMIISSVLDKVKRALSEMPTADVQEKKYCRMIPLEPDCRGLYRCIYMHKLSSTYTFRFYPQRV